MNAFTNYLEKLGSNFLVSAMVPSLALVIASLVVFDPILNSKAAFNDAGSIYPLVGFGLIVFIFTVIIGFTLTALNTFILKMFEGYVVIAPIRFLYNKNRNIHKQRARNLAFHRDRLEQRIRHLKEKSEDLPGVEAELEELEGKYYKSVADYSLQYPEDLNDILPTRFGNTLKAAENYSGERYGFDGVHFWPRLEHVIPNDYRQTIEHTRNELSFLVNMSILSIIFSSLCMLAFFYTMGTTTIASSGPGAFIEFMSTVAKYFLYSALGFGSFWFFYNASIFSVGSFGLMIRSSFDLFRMDLLRKLELRRPIDSQQEFETWQELNELIVLGGHSLTFQKLRYRPESETHVKPT